MSNFNSYLWPSLITLLAVITYFGTTIYVGFARNKYGIKPPATSGNENFERAFRIQMNTLEQMIIFLPTLWLFAVYMSIKWATILGALWVVGRILFAVGYAIEANKRFLGFAMGLTATFSLMIGSAIGIIKALLH